MHTQSVENTFTLQNATRWFSLFIITHAILWTVIPFLVRYNLPLDAIEGTIWGHQLEWGYDKNPFLNGWLTALATFLGGPSGWMIYLFSQLSVLICFWAVWKIANNMLSPVYALISVLILETMQYFNFHAIDFNDNVLELSLWALTSYFFYNALKRKHTYGAWIAAGLCAALGMMAKYYTIALLTAMTLFLFTNPIHRQQLRTPAPYLGLICFIIILLPHCIWLFHHDFITIRYVIDRASSPPAWLNHLAFPWQFTYQQFQVLIPALILLGGFAWIARNKIAQTHPIVLSAGDKEFLFYVGVAPLLLTVLLSCLFGTKLRAGWGMPLLSLWGIILVALIQPTMTIRKLYLFLASIFTLLIMLVAGYSYSLIYPTADSTSSANFPGRNIANYITQLWHQRYQTPLRYVAGSRWVGGNIAFYSPDHPSVFVEWDSARAPWINLQDLRQKGGVFVWEIQQKEVLPEKIQQAFTTLGKPFTLTFHWYRTQHATPILIGVAMLPPKQR